MAATAVGLATLSGNDGGAPDPMRLSIQLDAGPLDPTSGNWRVALSPDGRRIAYIASDRMIHVRDLTDREFREVSGTQSAAALAFTSSGDSLSFWQFGGMTGAAVRLVPLGGGPGMNLTSDVGGPGALSVGDSLVVTLANGSLAFLGSRGEQRIVAAPEASAGEGMLWSTGRLPDGRLLVVAGRAGFQPLRLDALARDGSRTRIVDGPVMFAAFAGGMLLTVFDTGEMTAATLELATLRRGPAVVLDTVRSTILDIPVIAANSSGTAVFASGQSGAELVIVDRNGRATVLEGSKLLHKPRISPDGRLLLADATDQGVRDVWSLDLADPSPDRITQGGTGHDPTWLRDGSGFLYIVFGESGVVGTLRRRIRGGAPDDTVAWMPGWQVQVQDVAPDGSVGVAAVTRVTLDPGTAPAAAGSVGQFDLAEVMLDGSRRVVPIDTTPFSEKFPAVSPDGRWLAYVSDESGQAEVYLRPFRRDGVRIKVSASGGTEPMWGRGGTVLYYRSADARNPQMVEASLAFGEEPRVLGRTGLFGVAEYQQADPHANYDVLGDGRFVMVRQAAITSLSVIRNWPELARRLLAAQPTGR